LSNPPKRPRKSKLTYDTFERKPRIIQMAPIATIPDPMCGFVKAKLTRPTTTSAAPCMTALGIETMDLLSDAMRAGSR
jgi:hypothetical protein